MARNEVYIGAPPRTVFELLADPVAYSEWVAGSSEIRCADETWPQPGSAFAHRVGAGYLRLADDTRVLDAEPPVMLKLRVRARPLPSATVALHLQPEGSGTRVTMIEGPANRWLSLLAGPLGHGLLALRNRESLRRLKELAEGARERPRADNG